MCGLFVRGSWLGLLLVAACLAFGTAGASASIGTGSCSTGFDVCAAGVTGSVGNNSCNGDFACTNGISGTVGDNSCIGYFACTPDVSGSVGDNSCNGDSPCDGGVSGTVGDNSCNGGAVCNSDVAGTVGDNSCNGTNACYFSVSATGRIGANACNGRNACGAEEITGVVGDCQGNTVGVAACAPVDSPVVSGTKGANGWYTSNVTVTWNWQGVEAAVDPTRCTQQSTSVGEGSAVVVTASCTDLLGETSTDSRTFMIDKTAPLLNPTVSPSPVAQFGAASATPNASDSGSGVQSASCGPVSTQLPGLQTVTCTAKDFAGNASSAQVGYLVLAQTFLKQGAAPSTATLGGTVADTATLTGGLNPTGSITFKLYGPNPSSCTNAPAAATFAVAVHGAGSYTSPSYRPLYAGNYYWVASYSGDPSNLGAGAPCGGTSGTVTVKQR